MAVVEVVAFPLAVTIAVHAAAVSGFVDGGRERLLELLGPVVA